MSLSETATWSVVKAVRRYLDAIPEGEPVVEITLAAVLCNFDPNRSVPIWLALVAPQGIGKTELLQLFHGWKPVWTLPDKVTEGYFVNAKNQKRSAIFRMEEEGARILLTTEMGAFGAIDRTFRQGIYNQLVNIHDGHLKHETGFDSTAIVYGPKKPSDRLGFLGAWTPEAFYEWQGHAAQLGSRFTAYYRPGPSSPGEAANLLSRMSRGSESDRGPLRTAAREILHGYLTDAITRLGELEHLKLYEKHAEQIAGACALTTAVVAPHQAVGSRLNARIAHIVRMLAYIEGRTETEDRHAAIGIRIAFSQLAPAEREILRYAADASAPWSIAELCESTGRDRRSYYKLLEQMHDRRVLKRSQSRKNAAAPHRYRLVDDLKRMLVFTDLL